MKKAISLFLSLALVIALAVPALAAGSDFIIEDGVLTGYNGAGGDIVIPNSVTKIAAYAFNGNDKLTGVTIPEGVTTLGESCFGSCSNLVNVKVAKSVTDMGYTAFYDTPWLAGLGDFPIVNGILIGYNGTNRAITIPQGVKAIGGGAFAYNDIITSITIPESVTSIGFGAFTGCANLTDVTIPKSVTEVGSRAFVGTPWVAGLGDFAIVAGVLLKYNGSDRVVTIPSGVKVIDSWAFNGRNIISVTIPEGVTEIRGNFAYCGAFSFCNKLTAVEIPKSVTDIGQFVFEYSGLKDIYYTGTEAEWNQLRAHIESIDSFSNHVLFSATIHYNSTMPAAETVGGFSDVYKLDYFGEAVMWAVNHDPQITNGVGGGKFEATGTVTRAQAVTFLWRAAGCPEPQNMTSAFSDVTDVGAWYYKAVLWAAEQNITNGVGDDKFGKDGTLAYDQMLTFMARAAGADASGDEWSRKAMTWAETNGLTDGLPKNAIGGPTVNAKGDCLRCDVVYFIWKQMA